MNPAFPGRGPSIVERIGLKSIPKRNEAVRWRGFGGDGILLDPRSGDYFEISETGLMIWEHADGRKTVEEIIRNLEAHFAADAEELARDTAEFIEDLASKGLISIEHGREEITNEHLS